MLVLEVPWTTQEAAMTVPGAAFLLVPLLVSSVPSPFPFRFPQKPSASFVSSSLTTEVSLLFLPEKSTAGAVGNADVDCATGSFCVSALRVPSRQVLRMDFGDGAGCDVCCYSSYRGGVIGN